MTTAGIGVMTSRASCSWRWKTPPSITASPGSSLPRTADCEISTWRSSEVGCCSSSCPGLTPKRRATPLDIQVSATVNGALARRNQRSGAARHRAVLSGLEIANSFGACSPTVTWRAVTSV